MFNSRNTIKKPIHKKPNIHQHQSDDQDNEQIDLDDNTNKQKLNNVDEDKLSQQINRVKVKDIKTASNIPKANNSERELKS